MSIPLVKRRTVQRSALLAALSVAALYALVPIVWMALSSIQTGRCNLS